MLHLILVLAVAGAVFAEEGHHEAAPINVDSNVKLIIVGMRHGNRNPGKFIPNDPNEGKWGQEGDSELTNIGKRQAYAAGKSIRDRYADLLDKHFQPSETKAWSSSANRCQMTLQSALAGIYPPKERSEWSKTVEWQPIPYTIDNQLLRMYAVDECKEQADAWKPISDDNLPNLVDWIERDRDLLQYIKEQTKWNSSLSDAADVADNLMNLKMMGLQMPDWVANPPAQFAGRDLYKDILKFAEAHQIACAEYRPCGYMMGGLWLNDIVNNLKKKKEGKADKLKLVIYASHTEITLSVMKLMHMEVKECPTSAGFILEYRDQPEPSVRLIFHEPDPEDPDKRILILPKLSAGCDGSPGTDCTTGKCATDGGWCPLQQFMDRVAHNMFSDWKKECKIPPPACAPAV